MRSLCGVAIALLLAGCGSDGDVRVTGSASGGAMHAGGSPDAVDGVTGGTGITDASGGAGGRSSADAGMDGGMEDSQVALPPLCPEPGNFLDIWSDARGPFLMASGSGTVVLSRETGAWNEIYRNPYTTISIVGFTGGDLVLGSDSRCGSIVLHNGVGDCSAGFVPGDFFVVSNTLAYALVTDRALVYDGSVWTQFLDPFPYSGVKDPAWKVWANGNTVAVTTTASEVFVSQNGAPFVQVGKFAVYNPVVGEFSPAAVWGFADNDLWIGDRRGVLRSYDGSAWTERATVLDSCGSGIRNLWGDSGILYFHTEHEFARWNAGKVEVLKELPCGTTIRSIWGNSASEVYLAVDDLTSGDLVCDTVSVFEWTGTELIRI